MQITINKPGLMSTIQDMGRWGYQSQGVPLSGVMDTLSARLANLAVGNAADEAVIEFTYAGAALQTKGDTLMAYSGDGALFTTGSQILPPDRPVYVPSGTDIYVTHTAQGCRTYLAVAGGWDVPAVLGSSSTYVPASFGGYKGRALQAGDTLRAQAEHTDVTIEWYRRLKGTAIQYPNWSIARRLFLPADPHAIRVVPAREFTWFEGRSVVDFLSEPFTVSNKSDRMGYHLKGPTILRSISEELLSTAIAPGTIQVTGNGTPLLLMADCQTTGGYPRIGQVAAVDMPLCAQLRTGDTIFFREISRNEAEKLYLQREHELKRLATSLRVYNFSNDDFD